MKCVVTGATGYIGTVLVRSLYEKEYDVVSLIMKGDEIGHVCRHSTIAYGDVCDLASLKQAFEGADAVIHLASTRGIGSVGRARMYRVNVGGTRNVIEACLDQHVKRLVYVGSVSAIPKKPDNELMTEVQTFDPRNVNGSYAKNKAVAAKMALDAGQKGLDVVVTLPSAVIGPYEYRPSSIGLMITEYLCGTLNAYPKNGQYNCVDVRDAANGIIAALEKGKSGESYILSGGVVSAERVFQTVSQASGKKMVHTKLPQWMMMSAGILAQAYYTIHNERPLVTYDSVQTMLSNCNYSSQKAQQELGVSFRPVDASLQDMTDWIGNHFIQQEKGKLRRSPFRS